MRAITFLQHFRGKAAAGILTAGVVLLCGASLLLPGVLGARQEAALTESPLPRPAVAGLPDEQARAIPILYDLYRARLQPGNFGWQEGDASLLPQLEQCLAHLAEAGVLPREMTEAVQPVLDAAAAGEEGASFLTQQTGSFAGVQITAGAGTSGRSGTDCGFVSAVWDTATGGVVSLNLSGQLPQADPAAMLDAWRQDLGLDALDDWQDEAMENGLTSWSDKAQVYLYCAVEEIGLRLTMTNLSGMDKGKS